MLLVRYGADPNRSDLGKHFPGNLLIASKRKKNKLANMLIKAGHNAVMPTADVYPQWITEFFMKPLSLTNICRIKIRNLRNRKNLRDFVWDLPIPQVMKNFLMMENFV